MTTKEILTQAVTAKNAINSADTETKNKALANMADALLAHTDAILEANKQDVEAARGKIIFGICGGYQMLGETLSDPHHVEAGGTIKGMGLLPMDTVFAGEKTRTRAEGAFGKTEGVLAGIEGTRIEGYEIHMGETVRKEETEAFTFIDDQNRADSDKLDGAQKGNVYGTYVHGIFDKEEVAERIVEALAKNKGIAMEQIHGVDYQTFKETQYDILADALREHLDMKKIYQILEEGA